jgi:hypothetical protein
MSHHSSLLKRLNERKVPTKITKPVEKPKQIDIEKEVLEERKKFDL